MDFMKWFIRHTATFPRHDHIFPSHLDALWANDIRPAARGKRVKTEKGNNILFPKLFYLLQ
jgi:hypothetical protein